MLLALAGKHAVASEVCRRGFLAQIARGERKHARIVAENRRNRKIVLVRVKAEQKGGWPNGKGIKGPGRIQVFAGYEGKTEHERPDLHIVDKNLWRECVKRVKEERGDRVDIRDEGGVTVFEWVGRKYYGISLRPENTCECEGRRDILVDKPKWMAIKGDFY